MLLTKRQTGVELREMRRILKEGRAGAGPEAGLGRDHQEGRLAQRGLDGALTIARERVPAVGLAS